MLTPAHVVSLCTKGKYVWVGDEDGDREMWNAFESPFLMCKDKQSPSPSCKVVAWSQYNQRAKWSEGTQN